MRLYALAVSHPAHSARLMLEQKGLEHETSLLLPGLHPVQLRLAGFRRPTVPALEMDGRRVQGSREIARALDALALEPPLFPVYEDQRRAVEEAERWGEEELQEVARRIFRWAAAREGSVRRWLAEIAGLPAPGVAGALNVPVAREFAPLGSDGRASEPTSRRCPRPWTASTPWYRAGSSAARCRMPPTSRSRPRFAYS
jgi:glutathione S-transferase